MPYTINTNSFELSNTDKQVFPNRSCLHRLDHIQIEQNWYSFLSAYCNHLGELKKKKKKSASPDIEVWCMIQGVNRACFFFVCFSFLFFSKLCRNLSCTATFKNNRYIRRQCRVAPQLVMLRIISKVWQAQWISSFCSLPTTFDKISLFWILLIVEC